MGFDLFIGFVDKRQYEKYRIKQVLLWKIQVHTVPTAEHHLTRILDFHRKDHPKRLYTHPVYQSHKVIKQAATDT